MSRGVELIAQERTSQIKEKKWTKAHDRYVNCGGQLARAAACYAVGEEVYIKEESDSQGYKSVRFYSQYPWDDIDSIEPKDKIKQLQIAGALIAAEIDRQLSNIT